MSLATALGIAQSSLSSTSRQTSVVARNVADAGNPDYTRRTAVVSSDSPGARVLDIRRAANDMLFRHNLSALSSWQGQQALLAGMEHLSLSVHGVDHAFSPATAIGKLQQALHLHAAAPSDRNLAETTIEAARQVVHSLNDGTSAIQTFRATTDLQVSDAVKELNTLLADFDQANRAVVSGTRAGRDVSDSLDKRDALLKKISEFVPVTTIARGSNDMVLTTKSGITLYETVPRQVSFTPTAGYAPDTIGSQIYVDGVPLAAGTSGNTDASGRLAAMLQLRDSVTATMQSQLDEVARGLIVAFAESDPAGAEPDAPGLFTWPGAPATPAPGTLAQGLAGSIRLNPAMDSRSGGDPTLLRDGGANGAAYVSNATGVASYSDLLLRYGDQLDQPIAFDPAAGNGTQASVMAYSTSAISWFEAIRQDANRAEEAKSALMARTGEALSNETGVNIDEEMSLLLDLEHSYQASARLMAAIDDMLAALMAAVR
jgi:flagellar hook-associated protein 1 FlgK